MNKLPPTFTVGSNSEGQAATLCVFLSRLTTYLLMRRVNAPLTVCDTVSWSPDVWQLPLVEAIFTQDPMWKLSGTWVSIKLPYDSIWGQTVLSLIQSCVPSNQITRHDNNLYTNTNHNPFAYETVYVYAEGNSTPFVSVQIQGGSSRCFMSDVTEQNILTCVGADQHKESLHAYTQQSAKLEKRQHQRCWDQSGFTSSVIKITT